MAKRIGIVGYGYVGKATHGLFEGHFDVSFYDINGSGNRNAVMGCDLAFVCVPTPEAIDGSADITAVDEAVSYLDAPLIMIKSTVPPGTTDRLAAKYGKAVHFSPEFIVERSKADSPKAEWVVVGGPRASEVLDYFLAVMPVRAKYMACSAAEAELSKYMSNAYFAMKVTFCNEFAKIAEGVGVDYKRLRELWLLDPRVDADHTAVFRDAPGFGGKCLPKDLSAIIAVSQSCKVEPHLLLAVRLANAMTRNLT